MHEDSSRAALTILAANGEAQKFPQFFAALAATMGALCAGPLFSWTSSVLNILQDPGFVPHVSAEEGSWIGSFMTLGAFVGCLPAGLAADRLGRQRTLLLLSVPLIVSWFLMAPALVPSIWGLYAGRFLSGAAVGALSVVTGMYVTEIAESSVRGTLGAFFQLQITIGILFGYIAGLVHDPTKLAMINLTLPVLFALFVWRMPESPAFLLMRGRSEQARNSLQWLRGPFYDIGEELARTRQTIMETQLDKGSIKDLVRTRAAARGMVVALGLMAAQQLSGVNAVIFYTGSIFEQAGSSISGELCSIIVGTVQVLATYLSTVLVDRAGRRVLLLLSCSVMAICLAVLGVYFHLKDAGHVMTGVAWLPLVAVAVFIFMFSLGMGPLPWCVVSEIFPPKIKGPASAIACATNWLWAFTVTKVFQNLVDLLGTGGTFWVFSSICVASTIFIAVLVPETKGKSLEHIQAELEGVKYHNSPGAVNLPGVNEEDEDQSSGGPTFTL